MSEQRWYWPHIFILIRKVFGDAACVRVTSTLSLDARTGKVVAQTDVVNNWLWVPLPLRLALGLTVPFILTVLASP